MVQHREREPFPACSLQSPLNRLFISPLPPAEKQGNASSTLLTSWQEHRKKIAWGSRKKKKRDFWKISPTYTAIKRQEQRKKKRKEGQDRTATNACLEASMCVPVFLFPGIQGNTSTPTLAIMLTGKQDELRTHAGCRFQFKFVIATRLARLKPTRLLRTTRKPCLRHRQPPSGKKGVATHFCQVWDLLRERAWELARLTKMK